MNPPDWMLDFLRQTPVLGVCMVVIYTAYRYVNQQHADHLAAVERYHVAHLASKDAEIARLVEDLEHARKEKDKLLKLLGTKEKP